MFRGSIVWRGFVYATLMAIGKLFCGAWLIRFSSLPSKPQPPPAAPEPKKKKQATTRRKPLPRPKSLYPASLLGCAMVARGEIGFLISALAASNGILEDSSSSNGAGDDSAGLASDIYLTATWAI